jgi:hypothetical protein
MSNCSLVAYLFFLPKFNANISSEYLLPGHIRTTHPRHHTSLSELCWMVSRHDTCEIHLSLYYTTNLTPWQAAIT